MQISVWFDKYKRPLAHIDLVHVLFGRYICELLDHIFAPIDGHLAPNE